MALVLAQQTAPITLDRAISMATEESERLRGARAAVDQAEGERRRARSGLFPQLSASAGYFRTLATEFSAAFESEGLEEVARDLPFGRANLWQIRLSLSQNIYSGGRIGARTDLAKASRFAADNNLITTQGQLELDVARAYYDAILADRFVVIAETTIEQAERTASQVAAGFRAGTRAEFDVFQAQVDRDNLVPDLYRARAQRDIAYLRLKQVLEIPPDEAITLTSDLDTENLPVPTRYADRFREMEARFAVDRVPVIGRSATDAAAALVQRQEANLKGVRAERRPAIAGVTDYANVTYPTGWFTDFGDIRTNWLVGIELNVPILTGGRQKSDEAIARAQLEAQRAEYELAGELADLDARIAWTELQSAQATWQASAKTVDLARRSSEIAEIRFQAGVSTLLEMSDARLQWEIARANQAQAARDLQVARIRLALLPYLPIEGVTAAPAAAVPSSFVPATNSNANRRRPPSTSGVGGF